MIHTALLPPLFLIFESAKNARIMPPTVAIAGPPSAIQCGRRSRTSSSPSTSSRFGNAMRAR